MEAGINSSHLRTKLSGALLWRLFPPEATRAPPYPAIRSLCLRLSVSQSSAVAGRGRPQTLLSLSLSAMCCLFASLPPPYPEKSLGRMEAKWSVALSSPRRSFVVFAQTESITGCCRGVVWPRVCLLTLCVCCAVHDAMHMGEEVPTHTHTSGEQ